MAGLEQHLIHDRTHPAHVAIHQMPIHVKGCGHVTVAQPGLNILGITAALAERVDSAVPQVVKAAGKAMCPCDPLKVIRDKIGINGRTVRPGADITGVNVLFPEERPVF